MRCILALCFLLLVVCTGCASYTPSSAPVPKAETMLAWRAEGPVAIGADPYVQSERQKATFDGDLSKAGVLPIQVSLYNRGDRQVLIRPSDMVLKLPEGGEVSQAGAATAAARLESNGGVIASSIAFGLVGFLVSSSAADKARAARVEDYRRKELQEVRLRKDETAHGFVYFIPAPETKPFTEATLKVRFVDVEEATSFVVPLPLSGLEFKGSTSKSE
jgi:hypothetical protein